MEMTIARSLFARYSLGSLRRCSSSDLGVMSTGPFDVPKGQGRATRGSRLAWESGRRRSIQTSTQIHHAETQQCVVVTFIN
eukprot:6556743-Pyramimonas_sp.AAC.1